MPESSDVYLIVLSAVLALFITVILVEVIRWAIETDRNDE